MIGGNKQHNFINNKQYNFINDSNINKIPDNFKEHPYMVEKHNDNFKKQPYIVETHNNTFKEQTNIIKKPDTFEEKLTKFKEKSALGEKIIIWAQSGLGIGMIILAIAVIIGIICASVWISKNYCITKNLHFIDKAKNGDCCKYGKTVKSLVCYRTSCNPGARNINGYCCKNDLTSHYPETNCYTTNCPEENINYAETYNHYPVCCLYGVTIQNMTKCYTTSCQYTLYDTPHPRTPYGVCCLNGLTREHRDKCNQLGCDSKDCNNSGFCCSKGVDMYGDCNRITTKNGNMIPNCNVFAKHGTCCPNGKTRAKGGEYCNDICNYHNGVSGVTQSGLCCKYGPTHQEKGCYTTMCNFGRDKDGNCCTHGVAEDQLHCNKLCNENSCHDSKGDCHSSRDPVCFQ